MSVEVCSYRLNLRGKPVGSQILRTAKGGQTVALEARLMLQGSLGQQTVTQQSRLRNGVSERFREALQDSQETRTFEVVFDQDRGLVRATRGPKDSAEIPYSRLYQDPLGLLYQLRGSQAERVRVPMLGKDVVAERLGDTTLPTPLGERAARVFILHPGQSYVYVDKSAPHIILKLIQRLDSSLLEALLVDVSEEEEMPEREEARSPKRGRKRRRRPSRRRGKSPQP